MRNRARTASSSPRPDVFWHGSAACTAPDSASWTSPSSFGGGDCVAGPRSAHVSADLAPIQRDVPLRLAKRAVRHSWLGRPMLRPGLRGRPGVRCDGRQPTLPEQAFPSCLDASLPSAGQFLADALRAGAGAQTVDYCARLFAALSRAALACVGERPAFIIRPLLYPLASAHRLPGQVHPVARATPLEPLAKRLDERARGECSELPVLRLAPVSPHRRFTVCLRLPPDIARRDFLQVYAVPVSGDEDAWLRPLPPNFTCKDAHAGGGASHHIPVDRGVVPNPRVAQRGRNASLPHCARPFEKGASD